MSNLNLLAIGFPAFPTGQCASLVTARPLENYDIVVINPVSPLHLLTGDFTTIAYPASGRFARPVEVDDHVFRSWEIFSDVRISELASFLLRGGLLVFFLSPGVVVTSADGGSNIGNYFWLDTLAPDGASQGYDRKILHRPAAGPVVITEAGKSSDFASYLQKFDATAYATIPGGALAEGFIPLAETATGGCAAGHLPCGDHEGGIVFLPGPYQQHLEGELLHCLERWSKRREGNGESDLRQAAASLDEALFVQQCIAYFEGQGLVCRASENAANEYTVVDREQSEIIVRAVFQDERFADYSSIRRELAALADSIIKCWSQAKAEPAGLLVLAQGKKLPSNRVTESTKDDPTFDRIADKYRIALLYSDTFVGGLEQWASDNGKATLTETFEL
ncbi:MAG: hypothetical protein JST01_19720 [Cyanobacteria bacterium SZAS TMP-1]|nr:hypothetical protein [Cyanobacteria bacterium SZAS TMP-1]